MVGRALARELRPGAMVAGPVLSWERSGRCGSAARAPLSSSPSPSRTAPRRAGLHVRRRRTSYAALPPAQPRPVPPGTPYAVPAGLPTRLLVAVSSSGLPRSSQLRASHGPSRDRFIASAPCRFTSAPCPCAPHAFFLEVAPSFPARFRLLASPAASLDAASSGPLSRAGYAVHG